MTHYNCTDTIWVKGDTTNTDEWDDDVLLHEFGHYVMKGYAQGPPSDTGSHDWPFEYPEKPGIGHGEGWAHFFSGRARAGTVTDSLIISTHHGIGGTDLDLNYWNLENPWDNTVTWPEFFQGGPWCEGAVAGALWDIYDSHNEIPYPSYPLLPQFPDTGLYDTLTMGFAPIWNVFDHYDPPGTPTNCWTIFDFRSGWNYYDYGHQFALNQILLHHRIRDSIPAAPTGLTAQLENNKVRLYWHKNAESDLKGYRIYRKYKQNSVMPPPPWSIWALLTEKNTPNDTTHLDNTVQGGYSYRYRVTAFDTLLNESLPSDSVQVSVPVGQNPDGSPLFLSGISLPSIITERRGVELSLNPAVDIEFAVTIYDCAGRMVEETQIKIAGGYAQKFDLKSFIKTSCRSSGIYFIEIRTDDRTHRIVRKIIVIK